MIRLLVLKAWIVVATSLSHATLAATPMTPIKDLLEAAALSTSTLAFERLTTLIEMNVQISQAIRRTTGERVTNAQTLRSLSSLAIRNLETLSLQAALRQLQNSDEIVQQMGLNRIIESLQQNRADDLPPENFERLTMKGLYYSELFEALTVIHARGRELESRVLPSQPWAKQNPNLARELWALNHQKNVGSVAR